MAMQGNVVLITGGGSGMGRLAAQRWAKAGKQVAILDINEAGLQETAEGFNTIHPFVVDITDFQAVKKTVEEAESKLGAIDRLYNCAAIMPLGKLLEFSPERTRQMMDINYNGLVNVTHAVLPGMIARGKGDFISFASMAGWVPMLLTGAYSASKFAVACYSETLYHENINSGIRFACVCPPAVATPLLQQGKETAWPKMLQEGDDPIAPEEVIDAIEKSIDKNEFWVFPNSAARWGNRVRRMFPGALWKHVHKVEGW
ncbi:MAG: SDR family NAD(P)-dependent oxidoreductase [Endozoicomonas sp.]|uniref:SDR family NAD(P)-dependent oxidoreductase n=1 Tax=Endozoicomonas sp. TaxID=1892382 RepID=UPI003D9B3AD0